MPFDAAPRGPDWNDDDDRRFARWLAVNCSLGDMLKLAVGLAAGLKELDRRPDPRRR
jgi:hypothetical protein